MHQLVLPGAGIAVVAIALAACAFTLRRGDADLHVAVAGTLKVYSELLLGLAALGMACASTTVGVVGWTVLVGVTALTAAGSHVWLVATHHGRWAHVLLDAWLVAVALVVPLVAFQTLAHDGRAMVVLLVAGCVLAWSTASTVLVARERWAGVLTTIGVVVVSGSHAAALAVLYLDSPGPARSTVAWAIALLALGWTSLLLTAWQTRGVTPVLHRAEEVRHPDQAASLAVFVSAVVTIVITFFYVRSGTVAVLLLSLSCVLALVVRQMLISRQNERFAVRLASRERYFRSLVQDSIEMLLVCGPDGTIEYVSAAVEEVLGLTATSAVGQPVGVLLDVDQRRFAELAARVSAGTQQVELDVSMASEQGELTLQASVSAQAGKVLFTIRDLTDRGRLREQLSYVASHDLPTDLLNRRGITITLTAALRTRGQVAVLFIDLDGFKRVNDAAGHDVGDRLLKAVAERLSSVTPEGCTLGRYGGDEFVVIVPDRDRHDPRRLAQTITDTVKEPYVWATHQFVLGASVGIALADDDSEADGLVRFADMAMYEAKKERLGYAFFEPRMLSVVKEQARADYALSEAFDAGRMHLLYQPIVDLRTGRMVKAEGLLRWIDVDGVVQGPLDLVEFVERTGRGQALSRWVIAEAVKQQVVWRERGHDLQVAINLSPHEFTDPALVVFLDQLRDDYGVPPGSLELEVTERAMIQDPSRAIDAMEALRARGVQVAVDDFGTGFSSLRYLLELPIDTLKLDKAFVDQVVTGRTARSIVQGIVSIGRELRLSVLAEGIETDEQRALVTDLGCHLGQGYLFASELTPHELERMLDGRQPVG